MQKSDKRIVMSWGGRNAGKSWQPTEDEIKALKDVHKRSKGWPVGIPVTQGMARRLVKKGLAVWAPRHGYI